jgi:hypothetical protein
LVSVFQKPRGLLLAVSGRRSGNRSTGTSSESLHKAFGFGTIVLIITSRIERFRIGDLRVPVSEFPLFEGRQVSKDYKKKRKNVQSLRRILSYLNISCASMMMCFACAIISSC